MENEACERRRAAKWPLSAALALLLLLPAAHLHAQATKIFVASTGNDANDGSRGSPKRNFQPAHDAVAAGGQIVVLDTAGYGALSITKSLAVTVPPGVNGFVTVSGSANGITVAAGANDIVTLRGLIVEGGSSNLGGFGIYVTSIGALTIEDCTVRNFALGIDLFSSTQVRVAIYNTAVRGCTYGLYASTNVSPYDRANAYTLAKGCRLEGCGRGAYLHGGGLVLDGCTVHGNSTGIQEDSGTVGVSNCTITDNTTGVFNNSDSNTGAVGGLGNNTLEQNTNGNSFAVAFSLE